VKKPKKIYEVTITMYDDGKVACEEKGCDILVSRPVSRHLNIGLLETMLTYMKSITIGKSKPKET